MVGTDEDYEALGAGLHVLDEPHPLKRAGHLAARMRADLCATLPQVTAAIEARSALPQVDPDGLDALRDLATRLARAQRIVEGTHARAVDAVADRLVTSGRAMAVHPSSIRDRASAVDAARQRLRTAEEALAAHDADHAARAAEVPEASPPVTAAPSTPSAEEGSDEPGASRSTVSQRRTQAIGVIVVAFGLGVVLLALDLAELWLALVPTLVACLWALRHLQPIASDDDAGRAATSDLLRSVAASTDDVFGARRATMTRDNDRTLLAAERAGAEEERRVAERAWQELAGPDVDVAEVDAVVRRFDPQHQDALVAAGETASVRAATMLVDQLRTRWAEAWGGDAAAVPAPAEAEAAVERVASLLTRVVVVVGPAIERAEDLALAAPSAPVIVLDGPIED